MTRLTHQPDFENELTPMIGAFFRTFQVASLLRSAGAYKQSGILVISIFLKLFILAFSGRSLFMSLRGEKVDIVKDTFYHFLNSSRINWSKFTKILSAAIINKLIYGATNENRVNIFMVDDTVYTRGRSKKVKLLSWVRDHSKHATDRGLRLLTLSWSDGNSFAPVNSCPFASQTKRCNDELELFFEEFMSKLPETFKSKITGLHLK